MSIDALKKLEKINGEKLTLGRLLWAIRTGDEITQIDFADKLGISKQRLCDIEHNRRNISPGLAAAYAKKLGYSQEQFIRLALQDMLDRENLHVCVQIKPENSRASRVA